MEKDQNGDISDDEITDFFKRYERRGFHKKNYYVYIVIVKIFVFFFNSYS